MPCRGQERSGTGRSWRSPSPSRQGRRTRRSSSSKLLEKPTSGAPRLKAGAGRAACSSRKRPSRPRPSTAAASFGVKVKASSAARSAGGAAGSRRIRRQQSTGRAHAAGRGRRRRSGAVRWSCARCHVFGHFGVRSDVGVSAAPRELVLRPRLLQPSRGLVWRFKR